MKIGFVGPATEDLLLRDAVEFLVGDAEVEQVVYLGRDGRLDRLLQTGLVVLSEGSWVSLTPTAEGPARLVELIADRLLIAVHDKGRLDEDDIASAGVIVWGRATEPVYKPIGPRCFLTPGPLRSPEPVVLVVEEGGSGATATLFETTGRPVWSHELALGRRGTVSVR